MEENKKPETTSQQDSAPVDYSRYMGTLNRIYRRNNNPQRKKLGDGIGSLKQQSKEETAWRRYHLFEERAENDRTCRTGKRKERPQLPDHTCCVHRHYPDPVGHQNVLNHIKTARNDLLLSFRAVLAGGICYRGCQIR